MGDPAGIGPEVIAKAVASRKLRNVCHPIVIGSFPVMERTIKALKLRLKALRVDSHERQPWREGTVAVLDPLEQPLKRFTQGVAAAATGAASVDFIKKGVELAQIGCIDGIVTAPINKEAINMAGCRYPGHTELLADLTRAKESGMMIIGGPLRIMFVTTHVAIKDLPSLLTRAKIVPMLGRRCEPAHLIHTVVVLAEVRGESLSEVRATTSANARRVFPAPKK